MSITVQPRSIPLQKFAIRMSCVSVIISGQRVLLRPIPRFAFYHRPQSESSAMAVGGAHEKSEQSRHGSPLAPCPRRCCLVQRLPTPGIFSYLLLPRERFCPTAMALDRDRPGAPLSSSSLALHRLGPRYRQRTRPLFASAWGAAYILPITAVRSLSIMIP